MIVCTLFISTLHPLLSFLPLPSLALLYVVCALLWCCCCIILGPYPFEPPPSIDPHLATRAFTILLVVFRFAFFLFDTVGCRYTGCFVLRTFLQNKGDTTPELLWTCVIRRARTRLEP